MPSSIFGLMLLGLSPAAGFIVFAAVCAPQLVVVALFSAIMFLVPRLLVGTFFVLCQQDMSIPAVYVLLHALCEELVRYKVIGWLLRAEAFFQAKEQVLHLKLSLIGLAVGVGFGLTQLMIGPGTLAAYSSQFSSSGDDVPFDPDVCPQLSLLVHTGLQSILLYACQCSWSVTMMLSISVSSPAAPDQSVGGAAVAVGDPPASSREMQTATRLGTAEETKGHDETARILSRKKKRRTVVPIMRHQRVNATQKWFWIASVAALHLLFSSFSLINSGAVESQTQQLVPGRGCVVSLPLQAVVLTISAVVAVYLGRGEGPARRDAP